MLHCWQPTQQLSSGWPLCAAGLNIRAACYWMQQLHPKVRCTKLSLPWSEGWYSWTWWISCRRAGQRACEGRVAGVREARTAELADGDLKR